MGLNIKKAIFEKGFEVREIAEKLGITNVALSQIINGNPRLDTLQKIANAIGCEVYELFDKPEVQANNIACVCPECGAKLRLVKVN